MDVDEQRAILSIVLAATFADGSKDRHERERLREIVDTLPDARPVFMELNADALMRRTDLDRAVAALKSKESRRVAYELAVGVCDAGGRRNAEETRFLASLAALLSIAPREAEAFVRKADAVVAAAAPGAPERATSAASTSRRRERSAGSVAAPPASATEAVGERRAAARPALEARKIRAAQTAPDVSLLGAAERASQPPRRQLAAQPEPDAIDRSIIDHAITTGALEKMPGSLASLAIVPLQMRMVQNIARSFGRAQNVEQTRALLSTLGVGFTSQYFENVFRKLAGGLLGKLGARGAGQAGAASDAASAFATTYAIGRAAKEYFARAGGVDEAPLRLLYQSSLAAGRSHELSHAAEIERRTRTRDIVQLLRGATT